MDKQSDTAAFSFGRHNPPTVGHEKLIQKTVDQSKLGHDHFVFTSHSQDKKKNPLTGEEKAMYIKHAFPSANVHVSNKEVSGPVQIAKHLHQKGYKHLVMVAGSDRVDEYKNLLHKYNGKDYHFKSIKVVSAGHRDPDAQGVEGMSGTKMRAAASSGDKKSFHSGLMSGLTDSHRNEIYDKVRQRMGLHENFSSYLEKNKPYLLMTNKERNDAGQLQIDSMSRTKNFDMCPEARSLFAELATRVDTEARSTMDDPVRKTVAWILQKPKHLAAMQSNQYED